MRAAYLSSRAFYTNATNTDEDFRIKTSPIRKIHMSKRVLALKRVIRAVLLSMRRMSTAHKAGT
jgi:hypothetical protein